MDPDDAPELTKEWFKEADIYDGERLVRRGRPPLESPKQQITLRLDADVIKAIRATGPGWSGRVNNALRRWVDRQRKVG
ncbi:MAG: BrnA antitoxin family protein [Variibacter sp.]